MDLSLDTKDIDVLARGFEKASRERPQIIARSINRALPKARTLADKTVRAELDLKKAYVQKRFTLNLSTYKKLQGRLTVKGKPILWGRFKHRATRKGVNARVNKGKARRFAKGGFVVRLKAGDKTIEAPAERVGGRYERTKTAKFKPLYGPSIPQVVEDHLDGIVPKTAGFAQTELSKQVERLMRRI